MSTLREAADPDWLDDEPFYNAMQRYRCAPREDQREVVACFEAVKRLVRAELAKPDAPDGWQVVPVELTPEMLDAMQSSAWLPICYRAMLAAAPVSPTAQPQAQPAQEAPYLLVGLVDCGECRTQGCQGVCRNARAHAPAPTSATVSEPQRTYPACKGTNCGATDGRSHSPECVAEHDAACLGTLLTKHIKGGFALLDKKDKQ